MDINYITDAKNEYTKQLQNILIPRLYEGIDSLYDEASKNNNSEDVLSVFQTSLRDIPKWNQDIIENESNRIIEVSGCEWLDNLITAVFISHTKILTAVKINTDDDKIDISVPRITHFIHRCYIEVAREIYKNPYLYDKSIRDVKEKQSNMRDALIINGDCISNAVRSLLPIKSLLNKYLGNVNNNISRVETPKLINGVPYDDVIEDPFEDVDAEEKDVDNNDKSEVEEPEDEEPEDEEPNADDKNEKDPVERRDPVERHEPVERQRNMRNIDYSINKTPDTMLVFDEDTDQDSIENNTSSILERRKKTIKKKLRFKDEDIKNVHIEENILPKSYRQSPETIVIKDTPVETPVNTKSSEHKQFVFF